MCGRFLWVGVIALVAVLRWPMLKGSYYKATNASAPASSVVWRSDFASAMREAEGSGKRLLVDFSAAWCPPCLVMKHDVWPDRGVGEAVNASYIPLLVDPDGAEGQRVAARYGVGSLPTVLILREDGTEVRRAGSMSASGVLEFLGHR